MKITAVELAHLLQGTIEGDPSVSVSQPGKIETGKAGEICFLGNLQYEEFAYTTEASILLVDNTFKPKQPIQATLIRVENVYTSLAFLLEKFGKAATNQVSFISEKASIHPSVILGKNVSIGDFTVVDEGVVIGDNCTISAQVFIGRNSCAPVINLAPTISPVDANSAGSVAGVKGAVARRNTAVGRDDRGGPQIRARQCLRIAAVVP